MSNTLIFALLSTLSIFSALMVIFSRNAMYSVLYLVICFFTIAGHYVILNAHFLAIVHIIVYAGAIMVLFLYTIMMLNLNRESEPHKPMLLKLASVVTGGGLFLVLISSLKTANQISPVADNGMGTVQSVGKVLFTDYVFPFEITSVLFISAMVGAVVLAKKDVVQ
ncbi:MAG: NADH-quinone oxidoreductase subunit J [Bacteroidota bacterium]